MSAALPRPLETVRTIRRLEYHRFLSAHEAEQIVEEICSAEVLTVPPKPCLLKDIWELRHTISPYDAAYLVLSRHFDCPLITFDEHLARAAAPHGVHVTAPGSGPAAAQDGPAGDIRSHRQ